MKTRLLIIAAGIFFQIGFESVSTFAQTKILVRQNSKITSLRGNVDTSHEKFSFSSRAAAKNFTEKLDPEVYEWEEVVPFQADDVSIGNPNPSGGSDPLSSNQWSLFSNQSTLDSYGAVDIDAARAWAITRGSSDIVIYVMDSGIDTRDPDLQGRVTSGFDAYNPGQSPTDQAGHGTHVASILGAIGGNNYGITGVVPGNLEIADGRFLNAQNLGDSDSALRVVHWMEEDMQRRRNINPNVKFIGSNSWGGDIKSEFLEQAMQRLSAYGYLPITSAGNHGGNNDTKNYYPCNFALMANTCVASSDRLDLKSGFSGYGPQSVHLLAPGDQIYGIIPGLSLSGGYQSKYETKRGTSQAVPHVAGVAALIWAANPNLSASDVRQVLVQSVDRLPGAETQVLSGGRLNAYRAVLMATGQNPSQADRILGANSREGGGGGCSLSAESGETKPGGFFIFVFLFSLGLLAFLRIRGFAR